MMTFLRTCFHALSLRESLLLTITIWCLLLAWLLTLLDTGEARLQTYKLNRDVLNAFEATLTNEAAARDLLADARQQVDPSKSFAAAQLGGQIDLIARETQLARFDIRTPSTLETDLFSFHNVRVRITRASLRDLIDFDRRVKAFAPYIALADFRLNANTRDPRFLDADFELMSFELKEDALND